MLEDEDTFLPTHEDRLKADINELRHRLNKAREEKQRLERELMEERISYLAAARFSDEIRDTTRHKATQMASMQQQILDQWMAASAARCVQEVISYYRLAGRTTFQFQNYTGIRLETYYRSMYHEPYYLLFNDSPLQKHVPSSIVKHTIPYFVPIERLADTFLPHDMDSLLRILHDFLLAYVSRREQVHELTKYNKDRPSFITVSAESKAKDNIAIAEQVDENRMVKIRLLYEDLVSEHPTKVKISIPESLSESYDIHEVEDKFRTCTLLDAYRSVFNA